MRSKLFRTAAGLLALLFLGMSVVMLWLVAHDEFPARTLLAVPGGVVFGYAFARYALSRPGPFNRGGEKSQHADATQIN